MRRVVITGLGLVSPLASGVEESWKRLIAGESGAGPITRFDSEGLTSQVACEVPLGDGTNGTFNADDWMTPKERKRVDDFILYGIAAAEMAIKDSGYKAETEAQQWRSGALIGAGIGGLPGIQAESLNMDARGVRRVSPHFIPRCLINLVAGNVSIRHGLKGPNHSVVTACASGTHAIGDAARLIALDDADVMVAGGAEAAICRVGVAGFNQLKALSTHFNDEPHRASRPYDRDRDGFVIGEGAGMLILEEYEHAKKRGAKIYGEIVGYGLSGDGHHVTAPAPDGNGGYRAMEAAMKRSGLTPSDIGYVNAHGTSTPLGDEIEFNAVKRMFGDASSNLAMSSTKSAIGHLLGAAGAVEAIFSVLAMNEGVVPPTLNLDNPSDGIEGINLVPHEAQQKKDINAVLSNSFGFGGTNASIIIKRA
ncbi:beta-ketoacyl-ACP synthase II [Pseudemcibacter aquimaris]|uniref:beta-ketoacyl-ACP synthase II n=1 Tax=Pseudemcibacter aquimaris TaxID=2857064 RepID=UPI0020126B67|nr:beta-ketoacyl-ACP synthase II [Pseudemcibacter aquimaris]MCC3859971.1 beta-ketoacyl-ACP synthase II [Pseudemcibacter aquimaris]WDU57303.1 beta-ketoacyl-ACP synthase II [Pseudemcibacter aquimaris]